MVFYVTQDTRRFLVANWIDDLWTLGVEVENLVRLMKGICVVVKKIVAAPESFMYVKYQLVSCL